MKIKALLLKTFTILHIDKPMDKIYWKFFHGFKPASKDTVLAIEKAFADAKKSGVLTKGDYFEFGVFKGYSIYSAQKLADKYSPNMRLFGFDSFAGLPELENNDLKNEFFTGQFAYSKENVARNIKNNGGDMKKILLIEGYFSNTLKDKVKKQYSIKKASIINIDCDLYSSTVDVLAFIKPLLLKNTIILFDDWFSFNGIKPSGEEKALSEFIKKYPLFKLEKLYKYGWHGQAFKVIANP